MVMKPIIFALSLLVANEFHGEASQRITYTLARSPRPWRRYTGPPKSFRLPDRYEMSDEDQSSLVHFDQMSMQYFLQKAYIDELKSNYTIGSSIEHDCFNGDEFFCLACELIGADSALTIIEDRLIAEFGARLDDIRWYYCNEAKRAMSVCRNVRNPRIVCGYRSIRSMANSRMTLVTFLLKKYRLMLPQTATSTKFQ